MTFSFIQHTIHSWFSFRRGQRFYVKYKEKKKSRRIPLAEALAIADEVLSSLATNEAVTRCSYSGSLRRMKETVGDIDMIAATNCPDDVVEAFLSLPQWDKRGNVIKKGELRKARAWTAGGIPVELWVSPPAMYGAALLALSGSAFHVDEVYKRALQATYGVVLGSIWHWCSSFTSTHHDLLYLLRNISDGEGGMSEEKLYEVLGMQWVPPPLRKGKDEVKSFGVANPPVCLPLIRWPFCLAARQTPETTDSRLTTSISMAMRRASARACAWVARAGSTSPGHYQPALHNFSKTLGEFGPEPPEQTIGPASHSKTLNG
jgi:hypothetical protein